MIQNAVMSEIENLKVRAEQQVRASLILEAIATQEKIEVKTDDFDSELKTLSASMNVEEDKLKEFYTQNPARRDDFVFRVRQERTLKFLLDKSKIKSV